MNSRPGVFTFRSFRLSSDRKQAVFSCTVKTPDGREQYTDRILLPRPVPRGVPAPLLRSLLMSLHLAMGISYYKTRCPGKIVHPYRLTGEQAHYWSELYRHGLGEFCYRNAIDPSAIARFPVTARQEQKPVRWRRKRRTLFGVGGGKDSIVVGEELKRMGWDATALTIESRPVPIMTKVIRQMGGRHMRIQRIIDPQLREPRQGVLNGHVPISAIYAWIGILVAVIYDYRYFLVGNEASSDSGNLHWRGYDINHQWSKSTAFEVMTRQYVQRWICPDVDYASPLRPFSELRVLQTFAQYPAYFPLFSSCNRNYISFGVQPKTRWCGQCPKCAWTFLGLTAFLPLRKVINIFGQNLLDRGDLLPLYRELLGLGKIKPFECVGTFEETREAFHRAAKRHPRLAVIRSLGRVVPHHDAEDVFRAGPAPSVPLPFQLLGMQSVVIVGYGREGHATRRWLRRTYPWIKVGVVDRADGRQYLDRLDQYDRAIKTPGQRDTIPIPYTTATNLFFGHAEATIVGVTGTKGKSTTASVIGHVLKTGGRRVDVLGNIGRPMLDRLRHPIASGTIMVLELSSFQLADLPRSPDIAVLLNVYPEHLDVHGNIESYARAKAHITANQFPGDIFVYNQHDRRARAIARQTLATTVAISSRLPVALTETKLQGEHWREDIGAAVAVARQLGVSEQRIRQGLRTFKPLPHRLQVLGTFRGITFIDDAISTTPESTMAALRACPAADTVFLGGTDRGYDFRQLERLIHASRVRNVVLFPDTGRHIFRTFKKLRILHTRQMKVAVQFAYAVTRPGRVCLLSCASPSYSLWKNFEAKGDEFQRWVRWYDRHPPQQTIRRLP